MSITLKQVEDVLIREDVEGLIAAGAPLDEYCNEAAQIVVALQAIDTSVFSEEIILTAISYIWVKSFELSQSDMELRLPTLRRIAKEFILF